MRIIYINKAEMALLKAKKAKRNGPRNPLFWGKVMKIKNISYTFENYGIEFGFQDDKTGKFLSAILQLPHTPDSCHSICGQDYDSDNERHKSIYDALKEHYYNDFDNIDAAKASIVCQERVIHVKDVSGFTVAFCETGNVRVLREGRAASYYNVFYYEPVDVNDDVDESDIIETAKESWFLDLSNSLKNEFDSWGKEWKSSGFPFGMGANSTDAVAESAPDEILGDFMRETFGLDWEESDTAQEFYEEIGCPLRGDAVDDLKEMLEERND